MRATAAMSLRRFRRPGSPDEVSVLAGMALIVGAGCLTLVLFPFAPDSPLGLMLAFGVVFAIGGVTLLIGGPGVSQASLHITVLLFTAMIGVMVAAAATERGLMLSALVYFATGVYVAFFFRRKVAQAYAAGMIGMLGLGLLAARAPTDATVWVAVSTMIWVTVCIVTRLNERLRLAAHTDLLTGLLNRTGFSLAADRLRASAARLGEPVGLAVIDLDDFKGVNDRDGHTAGDRLLVELATGWTASLRPGDLLARFGGDEFVLMLANATEHEVARVLERSARVHPAAWTAGAVVCEPDEPLSAAIDRADARLYAAKAARPRRSRAPAAPD